MGVQLCRMRKTIMIGTAMMKYMTKTREYA
jgi:hypothetical protein